MVRWPWRDTWPAEWVRWTGGSPGDLAERGDAKVDGRGAASADVELGKFVVGVGQAHAQVVGFPAPAFPFGFSDPCGQVVADLLQPMPLAWGNAQDWASDAALTEMILVG